MSYELQKASMPKRIAAALIDLILVAIIATGAAGLLANIMNYDSYADTMQQAYDKYEQQYGVNFSISLEEYESLTGQELETFEAALDALNADSEAMDAYQMVSQLILIITSLSILIGVAIVEFAVPLIFGNGQTLGKKIFSLCVIRKDGIKVNNLQLFTRSILGKFSVETMVIVYALMAWFFGIGNMLMVIMALIVIVVQLGCLIATANNCAIHDIFAGTVVVDHASQMIFKSTDDLISYQKKVAAERASRQPY